MLTTSERPLKFKEMIGQETVRRSLLNQSRRNTFFSTYVFCGKHGCGKTTTARILAKAIECEQKNDGEPCGVCEHCKAITAGTDLDVIEIDGASNNGVDKVRDLIDKVQYQPVRASKKIYIIDEVHMLSNGAFNALLKTLEEPPAWAVFILATTEPEKIPATVRSRSACYTFTGIKDDELGDRLKSIADKYGKRISSDAIKAIVKHSGGSVRDAIRDMETCFEAADEVSLSVVSECLGIDSAEQSMRFVHAMVQNQVKIVVDTVERWNAEGKQLAYVLSQALDVLADIVLYNTAGMTANFDPALVSDYARLTSNSRAYYLVAELLRIREMCRKESNFSVVTAELLLAANHVETDYSDLVNRVTSLETNRSGIPSGNQFSLI